MSSTTKTKRRTTVTDPEILEIFPIGAKVTGGKNPTNLHGIISSIEYSERRLLLKIRWGRYQKSIWSSYRQVQVVEESLETILARKAMQNKLRRGEIFPSLKDDRCKKQMLKWHEKNKNRTATTTTTAMAMTEHKQNNNNNNSGSSNSGSISNSNNNNNGVPSRKATLKQLLLANNDTNDNNPVPAAIEVKKITETVAIDQFLKQLTNVTPILFYHHQCSNSKWIVQNFPYAQVHLDYPISFALWYMGLAMYVPVFRNSGLNTFRMCIEKLKTHPKAIKDIIDNDQARVLFCNVLANIIAQACGITTA